MHSRNGWPDDLTIVVGAGASLFDGCYGLAPARPRELLEMPFLANDRLDPARCHGDLAVSLQAQRRDTLVFAARQLMRRTRRTLVLRRVVDGFGRGSAPGESTTLLHSRLRPGGASGPGLAFVSYQRSLEAGFLAVQRRLDGEPLEEYVMGEGGGLYFALPGVSGPGDVLGRSLLASARA